MMKIILLFSLALMVCCLACCTGHYVVKYPQDWKLVIPYSGDGRLLTKSGIYLQSIDIQEFKIDKEVRSNDPLKKDMTPKEVAKLVLEAYSSDKSVQKFEILKNASATISGNEGCSLIMKYTDASGLRIRAAVYALLYADILYLVRYRAADRYYFDKDFQDFEDMMKTFVVKPEGQM